MVACLMSYYFLNYIVLKTQELTVYYDPYRILNTPGVKGQFEELPGLVEEGFMKDIYTLLIGTSTEDIKAAHDEVYRTANCVYRAVALSFCFLLYSVAIQPRVWRKKLLEMIYGNPSFTYHGGMYQIQPGPRFIGTTGFYIAIGALMQFGLWFVIFYF